ncbi:Folate-dependent protein for Fe/S cluster synthesis/repair in oxidative stress [Hyphomicrobiales bacterium]|nr:Folate-dependent protein for Fe/S cluster synthesis/repair in oxidative stress [Hyphomicrobiales bacterium]CAH1699517.1 Folate-dependent protein for Fe/S cluster synthesis/repair in oxidative stress [Hyphomicrobiales bacterium]CAI0343304.1 tRNA-modifying protein YgfZ [Hyphomicrobiales bacterium]
MSATRLIDRGVIRVSGDDARDFLQNLVTNDLDPVVPGQAGYGALLTPQGKMICDFFIVALSPEDGGGFLLDAPLLQTADLMKRLKLYKLRAKVALEDLTEKSAVLASADGAPLPADAGLVYDDPRLPALSQRAIADAEGVETLVTAEPDAYHARRIALGIPAGGRDFPYGDTFPHEALLDQLGGVSFKKGCYIGQEVVSRMQHRGTARTRVVPIIFDEGIAAETGAEATAGGKPLGTVGSGASGRALAMLRLDRLADALASGTAPLGGGLAFHLAEKPGFIRFPFPGEAGFGAAAGAAL